MANKIVAITGATGTLGRAVCETFLDSSFWGGNEWTVYGCARNLPESERHWTGNLHLNSVDVASEIAVCEWFKTIEQVDALVTCAGVSLVKPSKDITLAEWHEVLDVNLTGSFLCAREAVKRGCRRVVLVGSIHGCTDSSYPMRAAYTASKAAVAGLARALAVEWGPQGVQVNAVCPGHLPELMPGTGAGQALLDAARGRTPTGRLATAEEVAGVVFWLCDGAPMSLTGQTVVVDGGFVCNTWPLGD
jgi:NAD(P)-dependent dehydrogenase (short-subunit alcohol dehydrogenase family)